MYPPLCCGSHDYKLVIFGTTRYYFCNMEFTLSDIQMKAGSFKAFQNNFDVSAILVKRVAIKDR